ncbi:hypothetical protein H696_00242 [Fonticula alba]|uniref:protein-tyrosine-phosphatase n=1 Tax=Fonticula alba TaxID=691883 RepID=A0A058ZGP1_FONAL|nr:hypothetical protein H696_00242 [Fonticula alba]KCV72662.1 hypothetical protein H696_00242 [Fonticula alba]|eukprot:XP_009492363.1 hypothetical protein H696_00242 [Fonticula alba]
MSEAHARSSGAWSVASTTPPDDRGLKGLLPGAGTGNPASDLSGPPPPVQPLSPGALEPGLPILPSVYQFSLYPLGHPQPAGSTDDTSASCLADHANCRSMPSDITTPVVHPRTPGLAPLPTTVLPPRPINHHYHTFQFEHKSSLGQGPDDTIDLIVPGLYLSGVGGACSRDRIDRLGIRTFLNLSMTAETRTPYLVGSPGALCAPSSETFGVCRHAGPGLECAYVSPSAAERHGNTCAFDRPPIVEADPSLQFRANPGQMDMLAHGRFRQHRINPYRPTIIPAADEGAPYTFHWLPIEDRAQQLVLPVLPATVSLIAACLERGEPILVHCNAGVSRSATVVLAFLICHFGWTLRFAMDHVAACRPIARCVCFPAIALPSPFAWVH